MESAPVTGSQRLQAIGDDLRTGKPAPTVTVREFLQWFGAARRGQWIVSGIRQALGKAGLVTYPDFEEAFIDAGLTFRLATDAAPIDQPGPELPPEPATPGIDPTVRLSRLKAANTPPVSVKPDSPLSEATTLMVNHDFSQLPVMTNERTVRGMITWRSIATRWAFERDGTYVREFTESHAELPGDRSLFAALPLIVEHGYVLVRDATNRVTGIVTATDITLQFQQLSEPFLLIGEIENHVRRLMDGRFSPAELATARVASETSRQVQRVADLTLGECLRFIGEQARWARLGLPVHRETFLNQLETVRTIRNEVMHFDPDPLTEEQVDTLRRAVRMLRTLHTLGI